MNPREARSLAGQSVLVTGGGSGMGAGIVERCVAEGARVTIVGRRAAVLEAMVDDYDGLVAHVVGDLVDEAVRADAVGRAVEHGGGLDALIHCAADVANAPLVEMSSGAVEALIANNLTSTLHLTAACIPHLADRQGSVVFFSSAHVGRAFPNTVVYAATKGALETVTQNLALELGSQGVRVNCIRPGVVPSNIALRAGATPEEVEERMRVVAPMHALGRIGTVEEIADAVLYLLKASWTTGAVLTVDGGFVVGRR
jgi:3-oxoacyl-[acyl-carrier protein] reductase